MPSKTIVFKYRGEIEQPYLRMGVATVARESGYTTGRRPEWLTRRECQKVAAQAGALARFDH